MRSDRFGLGLALGLLAPVIGFFIYGALYVTAIRPMYDMHWFIHDLFLGTPTYRAPVISLSLIADAFLFFWFDRKDRHKAMRGVIAAMLAYAAVVVICWF